MRTSFLIIGGDDGSLANFEPKSKHPGFPKRVLSYDTKHDRWSVVGETPVSRATLPTAVWNGLTRDPERRSQAGRALAGGVGRRRQGDALSMTFRS